MKSASFFDRIPRVVRRGECLVGGMVILAAAILILPVPPGLMDFLLALNISLSVVLLLLVLQVGETLKVAAFPTMLLVATLFRLALNVSTTRLILLRADAGEVVRSFGDFVVAGNPLDTTTKVPVASAFPSGAHISEHNPEYPNPPVKS